MTQTVKEGLNAWVHSTEENTVLQTLKSCPFTLAWISKQMPHIPGTSNPSSRIVMVSLLLFAWLYLGRQDPLGKTTSAHNRHNIYSSENVCLTSSAGCPLLWQLQENLSALCSASLAVWGCHPLLCLCWLFSTYLLTLFHPSWLCIAWREWTRFSFWGIIKGNVYRIAGSHICVNLVAAHGGTAAAHRDVMFPSSTGRKA